MCCFSSGTERKLHSGEGFAAAEKHAPPAALCNDEDSQEGCPRHPYSLHLLKSQIPQTSISALSGGVLKTLIQPPPALGFIPLQHI